jgi:hypothetical protein
VGFSPLALPSFASAGSVCDWVFTQDMQIDS